MPMSMYGIISRRQNRLQLIALDVGIDAADNEVAFGQGVDRLLPGRGVNLATTARGHPRKSRWAISILSRAAWTSAIGAPTSLLRLVSPRMSGSTRTT